MMQIKVVPLRNSDLRLLQLFVQKKKSADFADSIFRERKKNEREEAFLLRDEQTEVRSRCTWLLKCK